MLTFLAITLNFPHLGNSVVEWKWFYSVCLCVSVYDVCMCVCVYNLIWKKLSLSIWMVVIMVEDKLIVNYFVFLAKN